MAHQPLLCTREELAERVRCHPGLLRLQVGFNPNSSSVGSVVQFMLWSAVAATAVYQTASLLFPRTPNPNTTPGSASQPPQNDPA